MERLTERSLDYCTQHCPSEKMISCAFYKDDQAERCLIANMYDRLAAYEDTGLKPDAIEELLAFAKFVARQAIDTGDNDGVSAEILCRKLNKLGLIETDGEFWMIPTPPKEVE